LLIADYSYKWKRQATLAIACLFLNLSRYLSIGGASEAVQYMPDHEVWQYMIGPEGEPIFGLGPLVFDFVFSVLTFDQQSNSLYQRPKIKDQRSGSPCAGLTAGYRIRRKKV
jgi:hypothetical protein